MNYATVCSGIGAPESAWSDIWGNALHNKGIKQGGDYASKEKTNTIETLSALQKEIGEEAFTEWGFRILGTFQQEEILQQALHGKGLRYPTWTRNWVLDCTLSCKKGSAKRAMYSVWETTGDRCTSQKWESSGQLARKLGAFMSELSQPYASQEKVMQDLWCASKGVGVLREALSAFQKIRDTLRIQTEPAYKTTVVRRLSPLECEFLQGFPRNYTLLPGHSANAPRYKALGNSMAVPVIKWIGERIQLYRDLYRRAYEKNQT